MISDSLKNEYINSFKKFVTPTNAKNIINGIVSFATTYAEDNMTPFLIEEIFKTKVDEIVELFNKSDFLKNSIKDKSINPEELCSLSPEELDPDTYQNIIKKKELIELKKNSNSTTDAYTCKKCKNNKCNVTERQTRAGDEPATVYISCVECGYTFTI